MSTDEDPHASVGDAEVAVDLSERRRIHVIGIGGAAMNAISTVLVAMGHEVSGSDLVDSTVLDRLRAQGIDVAIGHRAEHVPAGLDLVVVSTAIPADNPELVAARTRHLPVGSRASILAAIAGRRRTVAVAGTHGKTTTTSMLSVVLRAADRRPSFLIGGEVASLGGAAAWDDGDLFVCEADESDGTFLALPRHAAIVTSVEPDHLDHYGDFEHLKAAFKTFLADTPGPVVVCADDVVASELGLAVGATTYGTAADADYRLEVHPRVGRGLGIDFSVHHDGAELGPLRLPQSGLYNARNAVAALAMATELGVPVDVSMEALAGFGGVARRFEPRGEVAGFTFVDDYAHIPTEVASAVRAALDATPGRVICTFQPHRYSRTASLWRDFADAFEGADVLVITDIYPAGESARPGVTGLLIVHAVLDRHPRRRVAYLPRLEDAAGFLAGELRAGDLCLTLGAGDITTLPDEVQRRLASR